MGYVHGIKWTEQKVKDAVFEVVEKLELDRMPTALEIKNYYNSSALVGKITRSGGFYYYADIYGLKIKKSESAFGLRYEEFVKDMLILMGHDAELTPTRFPYDILVNGRVKVDVKVGRIIKSGVADYYTFNIEKTIQTCDLYVIVTLKKSDEVNKIYIIPASIMKGKSQLSIGIEKSQYHKYVDRWNYIDVLDGAFKQIEADHTAIK